MYSVRGVDLRNHLTISRGLTVNKLREENYTSEEGESSSEESCCAQLFNTTFKCYESEVRR